MRCMEDPQERFLRRLLPWVFGFIAVLFLGLALVTDETAGLVIGSVLALSNGVAAVFFAVGNRSAGR